MIQNNCKMIKTNSLSGNQTGQSNFNPDKCKVLRITNESMLITQNYIIHSQVLEVVDSSKYLGIHIHKQLSWNTHVGHVVKKANQVRYFLQKISEIAIQKSNFNVIKHILDQSQNMDLSYGIHITMEILKRLKWCNEMQQVSLQTFGDKKAVQIICY